MRSSAHVRAGGTPVAVARAAERAAVALAELMSTTLVTLDRRIGRAPDVRCSVSMP